MAANNKGYAWECFEEVPELFKCRVCSLVLRDPHLTKCCGQNICLHCADTDGHQQCPVCGSPALAKSLNRQLREDILQQKVYCHAKEEGCKWIGILERLDDHEYQCDFVSIECKCGAFYQRRSENEHKRQCPRFPVTCVCGREIERWILPDHKKECVFEHVKCPFHSVDCAAVVQNKSLESHFKQDLPAHIALVSKQTTNVQKKWKQAKVRKEADEKNMNEKLDAEIARLTVAIKVADEKASELSEQLKLTEDEIRRMVEQTARERKDFSGSSKTNDTELREIEGRVATLRLEGQKRCFGPQLYRPPQITSRPTLPCMDEHPVPFTFLINNFSDLNAHDILVYSPPFYTHRRGYKMCLKVYCNGDHRGRGKFLSIYVQLLKGKYDHRLSWPVNGTFTVVVLNQLTTDSSDVYHKSKKITFGATKLVSSSQVLSGYLAEKWVGIGDFLPLSILFPVPSFFPKFKYIVNNALKIQVSHFQ